MALAFEWFISVVLSAVQTRGLVKRGSPETRRHPSHAPVGQGTSWPVGELSYTVHMGKLEILWGSMPGGDNLVERYRNGGQLHIARSGRQDIFTPRG